MGATGMTIGEVNRMTVDQLRSMSAALLAEQEQREKEVQEKHEAEEREFAEWKAAQEAAACTCEGAKVMDANGHCEICAGEGSDEDSQGLSEFEPTKVRELVEGESR